MSRTRSVRQHRLTRRIFGAIYGLPKRTIRVLDAQLDAEIPMPDGVVLLADRWAPASLPDDAPTVLVRTCYDRKTFWSLVPSRPPWMARRSPPHAIATTPQSRHRLSVGGCC
jgi:predicted acyl esterase